MRGQRGTIPPSPPPGAALTSPDLIVVGAGLAGLALAAEAATLGLAVVVLDPEPTRPWPNTFGVWLDEVAPDLPLAHRWSTVEVAGRGWRRCLDRPYGLLDRPALRARLLDRLERAGGRVEQGVVAGATHDERGPLLALRDGREQRAGLVVDCSGHAPALVERRGPPPSAFQVAYGLVAHIERHPWQGDTMTLMDFDGPPGDGPATFLYAMPLGGDRVFVEETILVARGVPDPGALRPRLLRRLQAMGLRLADEEEEERCVFPMDPPPPVLPQRVLALGAAASMVHPATGYSVAASLREAPVLAQALVAGLDAGPTAASRAGWQVLWPAERRAAWTVLTYGREAILSLSPAATDDFFRAFFAMPRAWWVPFLSGRLTARQAGAMMARMFLEAPMSLRLALSATAGSPPGLAALGAMLRP